MSSDVSFKFDTKKLKTAFRRLKKTTPIAADQGAKKVAERLRDITEQLAPKKTGKYAKQFKVEKISKYKYKVTHPNKKLLKILEFTGKKRKLVRGDPLVFEINGETIFATFANTGPFKPMPHLRPALKKVKREAKAILVQEWKKSMGKINISFKK